MTTTTATLVFSDVLGGVQELVELADRGLAHIFNEPWPPPPMSIQVRTVVRRSVADGRKQSVCKPKAAGRYYEAKMATTGGAKVAVKTIPRGASMVVGSDRPLSKSNVATKAVTTTRNKVAPPPSRYLKKKVATKRWESSTRKERSEDHIQTRTRDPKVKSTLKKAKPTLPPVARLESHQRANPHARFPKASPLKIAETGLRYSQNPLANGSDAVASGKIDGSKHRIEANAVLAQRSSRTPGLERVNDNREAPGIRLNDIRPDPDRCDVLLIAVAEMEVCKAIFAGWRAQLDLTSPRETDELENSIMKNVDQLDGWASAALESSHEILRNYKRFLHSADKRLSELVLTKSGGPLFLSTELTSLSKRLTEHSKALARYVKRMQETLRQLVLDIEKTKALAERRALRRKIWGWVAKVFKALSALLSATGAVFAFFYPVGLLESAAIAGASMFSGAVAHLCQIVQDKYNETTFDEILVFLRDHVPESAKAAELALTSFQACHRVVQLDLEIRQGKRMDWISSTEARRSQEYWSRAREKLRDVAV